MKRYLLVLIAFCVSSHLTIQPTYAQQCCDGSWQWSLDTQVRGTHYAQGKCVDEKAYNCLVKGDCFQGACVNGIPVNLLESGALTKSCPDQARKVWNAAPDSKCRKRDLNANDPGQYCDEMSSSNPTQFVCKDRPPIKDDERAFVECPDNPGETCISTPFGVLSTNPQRLVNQIIRWSIGAGSGVAFLLIIYASYKIISSQGNPEGINAGKEVLTSAIIGLVFIILSVTLLQIIGFDILGLGPLGLGTR